MVHSQVVEPLNQAVEPLNYDGLADQIYERLRRSILGGQYPPGSRVNPKELALRFRASITPVRDAIRRLATDGLVEIVPRNGVFIVRITREMARETFEIRELLECGSASRLSIVSNGTSGRMRAIAAEMEALQD